MEAATATAVEGRVRVVAATVAVMVAAATVGEWEAPTVAWLCSGSDSWYHRNY